MGKESGMRKELKPEGELWVEFTHPTAHICGLCGNTAVIDTRGRKSPAGYVVGGLHWCICPNGRAWKENQDKYSKEEVFALKLFRRPPK